MPTIDARNNKDLLIMIMALGDAYLEKGLYGEAVKRYNQLLQFRVANKHIYTQLSKALIGLKKFDEKALAIYQKAIQYEPNNAEIYEVLARSFLKEGRDDAGALQVYEMALRSESAQFDKIAHHLSMAYFRQQQYDKCRHVTARLLNKSGYVPQAVDLHLRCSWQTAQFHETINLLKKLIDTTENPYVLTGQLCMTYLEKKFNGETRNQPQRFSFIDRHLVMEYLHQTKKFDTLQDLSFYLELKRFLFEKEYWGSFESAETVETESIYAYHSLEETQEQGGQARGGAPPFNLSGEVLNRLSPFETMSRRAGASRSTLTYDDFQKEGAAIFSSEEEASEHLDIAADTEILVTIELSNFDQICEDFGMEQVNQIRKKFFAVLTDCLEKYQVNHVWATANGLLIFTNDIIQGVSLCVDLLNILNRYNFVNEPQEQVHLAIGVHHAREGLLHNSEQTLRDLSTGLKIGIVSEPDLSVQDKPMYGKVFQKTDRIFLSAKAYREIKSSNRFKVNAIGQFKLKYLQENLSLFEVAWRNPIDELKFGYIKKLGRFELLAELGGKGAIKVYKAKDTNLQRFVILKVIQSEVFNSLPVNNPQKREFYQIASALGQLNHPNIVTIYEVDEDQDLTYIAREFVEGVPFTAMFKNGNFNGERFIKAIYQVFKGLVYSHRLGFFHLNLKPNNIMLGGNEEPKLMDFLIPGTLFDEYDNLQDESERLYLSPEQLHGQRGDNRSDIFSLGVIMYQVLTLKHPFMGGNYPSLAEAILNIVPPPPSTLNSQVPRFCDALVLKCLEKQPDNRFQTAEQVVNLLKKNFERILFSNFNFQIAQARDSY
ncbi:MAG: protein kinase [bacterium]